MLTLRLFVPDSWTSDLARMRRAGRPEGQQLPRSKPEMAIEEIDRARAADVRFDYVLAGTGYGPSAPSASAERARNWAVGIPERQKVYPRDVALIFPVAGRGGQR